MSMNLKGMDIATANDSRRFACGLLFLLCFLNFARAQNVTISNNLLYDSWLTPNLRVGLRLAPHWSAGLTAGYRPWPADDQATRKLRHVLVSPSLRYWTDSVNVHHFFGANLIYSHYNVSGITFPFGLYKSVRNERHEGDLAAIGIFYGYSWPLGRHWNIEALVGAALGYTWYNRYQCGHCGQMLEKARKMFAMPQAAINIVYNLPGRPAKTPTEVPAVIGPTIPATEPVDEPAGVTFVPAISQVPDFTGRAGQLQKDNPVLMHYSQYKPYDRTQILRKDKQPLYVYFPLAKSVLQPDFRENKPVLERIVDITTQIMNDTTSSVKVIQIVGLASIEGGIASNEQLADNRALALQHYLQEHVDVPDSLFETVGGGEAWAEFRYQLAEEVEAGSPRSTELQQAIDIIDSEADPNRCEQQLRRMNGGRTWQYIKQHILSDQRNSGYIRVYYDYVPDVNAQIINKASELLKSDCPDCHHMALEHLQKLSHDERALNALGVAYYLCGQRDEAIACFRRAAAQGNADAQENLRQIEKE